MIYYYYDIPEKWVQFNSQYHSDPLSMYLKLLKGKHSRKYGFDVFCHRKWLKMILRPSFSYVNWPSVNDLHRRVLLGCVVVGMV